MNATVHYARTIELPANTTVIKSRAFANLKEAELIVIPEGVSYIAPDAFAGTDAIISVTKGSYAESWAIENGAEYIVR